MGSHGIVWHGLGCGAAQPLKVKYYRTGPKYPRFPFPPSGSQRVYSTAADGMAKISEVIVRHARPVNKAIRAAEA